MTINIRYLVGAAMLSLSAMPVLAEPVGFTGLVIENLDATFVNYSSGTPNSSPTRQVNVYKGSTLGLEVFEGGTFLTSGTLNMKGCMIDGAMQTPSFSYRIGEKNSDKFDCKINDDFERAAFKTKITGTASFEGGVLKLSGKVVQTGTSVMHSATDIKTSMESINTETFVLEVKGKNCRIVSIKLDGRKKSSSPATSRHFAIRNEDTVTYRTNKKSTCKVY